MRLMRNRNAKDTLDLLLNTIQEGIWHDRRLEIVLSCRPSKESRRPRKPLPVNEGLEVPEPESPPKRREFKRIRHPGKNKHEEWQFSKFFLP